MPRIGLEPTTKAASMLCSTNWASQAFGDTRNRTWEFEMQTQYFTKLNYTPYPKKDSNLYGHKPTLLKSVVSSIPPLGFFFVYNYIKVKVTWTLIITVMSGTLYQLSYNLHMRIKGSHLSLLVMSQICYYYTYPLSILYKK